MTKKNKLYTVTRFNRPMFMPKKNLFDYGGLATWDRLASKEFGAKYGDNGFTLGDYMGSKNALGISKANNPFSKGNLAGVGSAMGNAALSVGAGLAGGLANSAISGGLSSGAGSAISNIGGTIGGAVGAVNPVAGAVVGLGSQVIGGLVNRMFGESVDQEKLNKVNENISALNNFTSNAGSFDEIQGPQAVSMDTDVYEGGWFSSGDAEEKNRKLREKLINAKQFAQRSVDNNIFNLVDDQKNNALRNYSAFGGPLFAFGGNLFKGGGPTDPPIAPLDIDLNLDPIGYEIPQEEEPVMKVSAKLADEVIAAPRTFTPTDAKNDIRDFYVNDFAQRRQKYHPTETSTQIGNLFDNAHVEFGDIGSGVGGTYNSGNITVSKRLSDNSKRSTIAHEMRHLMDDQLGGLTPEENQILHDAYNLKAGKGYQYLEDEYPTTNTELRYQISRDFNNATGEDLNKIIQGLPDDNLIDRASWVNGYNQIPDKILSPKNDKQRLEQKKRADAIRRALMEVADNGRSNIGLPEANITAFGGQIMDNENNMGAIEYGFMSDYLDNKRQQAEQKSQLGNLFVGTPGSMLAFGGDLQAHGGDYPTGLTHIDAGGSHEENPNDGVQMGVDQEGTPNLVEEGEVIWDDYVFSNRINMSEEAKKVFRFPKKKDITYAEAAKRLEKEIAERPNDPISEAGFKAQMQNLEEQQELQKQQMEAERAKAAFEALSPEEQAALMQRVAQERDAAIMMQQREQEAAMQGAIEGNGENTIEMQGNVGEQQADDSQAVAGQESPMMAEGGHLYAEGSKLNPYAYSKSWDGFDYFDPTKDAYDEGYLNFVKGINQNWVDRILKGQYGSMDRYLAKNKGITLTPEQVAALATDKKYSDMHKAMAAAYKEYLAGIDPKTGKPVEQVAVQKEGIPTVTKRSYIPQIYHALDGDEDYITGEIDPSVVGDEVRRTILPNGDTVIYHAKKDADTSGTTTDNEQRKIVPDLKKETSIGMFGPVVGLGMQLAGIGKPDYSEMNKALASAARAYHTAKGKYIGNYLKYAPLDTWFEIAKMDAASRATDRAIQNSGAPIGTKMAGLLANGYNNQIAQGELYRKANEYNDAKRAQVAEFNRGTDKYNADVFNSLSQFNTQQLNRGAEFNAQMQMQAARDRMDADRWWTSNLYGNVNSLFDNISQWEKWKRDRNTLAKMYADGLAGIVTPETNVANGLVTYGSKGGKISKKKNKKKGLTY